MTAHVTASRVTDGIDVAHHARVAIVATEGPIAARITARDVIGIAATIEQEQDLTTIMHGLLHR